MMVRIEMRARCKTCEGTLIFHNEIDPDEMEDTERITPKGWAHANKELSETAGHVALPDRATEETVEVK